jgi:hypothetical protein
MWQILMSENNALKSLIKIVSSKCVKPKFNDLIYNKMLIALMIESGYLTCKVLLGNA